MTGQAGAHTNRPELVAVHGYDTKYAMHALRLGLQGIELLTTGRITLPVPSRIAPTCDRSAAGTCRWLRSSTRSPPPKPSSSGYARPQPSRTSLTAAGWMTGYTEAT